MNLTRRRFGCSLCTLAALVAAGRVAADGSDAELLPPGYRPAPSTDEKGLWAMMDRAEAELKQSRFIIRDPATNAYLREVSCRLAQPYCPDLRIYLVRTAQFNASMAPNGMMQVWTGLLLRCTDEAQFAAVVGHEMGHYLRQHSVRMLRDARNKSALSTFVNIGLSVAGLGPVGQVSDLALTASMFSFSRDQEREADAVGLQLMTRAGYEPIAAAQVWEQLLAELNASGPQRSQQVFFATHPDTEERMRTLRAAAERLESKGQERGRERYLSSLSGLRSRLVADELALRQYARSEVVFERLLAQVPDDGTLWYAKGEVYRLRAGPGDYERALAAYDRAARTGSAPPDTWRSIMLVQLKLGGNQQAQAAFEEYVKRRPDANDLEGLRMLMPK